MVTIKYEDSSYILKSILTFKNIMIGYILILLLVVPSYWVLCSRIDMLNIIFIGGVVLGLAAVWTRRKFSKFYTNLMIRIEPDRNIHLIWPNRSMTIKSIDIEVVKFLDGRLFFIYKDKGLFKKTLHVFPTKEFDIDKLKSLILLFR